jgi:putative ABC transport system permease protein
VSATRRPWGIRAFRVLLALYPGEFRDEYGREVAMVFADRYRRATSARQRAGIWMEGLAGVLREAPKEHVRMIVHDCRFAARIARRSPGFAGTVVLTLALGIGANTAIFQLINAVRLRNLPIRDASELAEVRIAGGTQGFGVNPGRYGELTRPIWEELRSHQQALSETFAWATPDLRVGELSDLRSVNGIAVSAEFFHVLRIQPWRGRLFEPSGESGRVATRQDDAGSSVRFADRPCPDRRAVVSHTYWQSALGGREPGRDARLRINGELHEVIGVTPPGFFGLAVGENFDVAIPLCQRKEPRRELFDVAVMGRLAPGWTMTRASDHLAALSAAIFDATTPAGYSAESIQRYKAFRLAAYPAAAGVSWLRTEYDTPLNLLLAITGLVLLIACANLANLMLARALTRSREVSVRLTLGASRTRLLRQFLAESALLASIGAAAGVGLAQLLSRGLIAVLSGRGGSPTLSLATDWRVLLFTGAVAMGACVVFGVAPAFRAMHAEPADALRSGGRAMTAWRGRFSTQRLMVVTQIAVSLVLLVAALLFVRSFRNLTTFDPGMRRSGIVVGRVGFGQSNIAPERFNDFQRELVATAKAVPGVIDAATTTQTPLLGGSWTHEVTVGGSRGDSRFTWVGPGYFATMGIPIVEGRDFTLRDTAASAKVAIVNQTFVRRWIGGGDPIGRTLRTSPEPRYPSMVYEIVGVIRDTQYNNLRGGTPPMAFAPDSQYPNLGPWANLMIHSRVEPAQTITAVRNRLAQAHPGMVMEFDDFGERILNGLTRERLLAMLAGAFGALAALLATVGLYGMISFTTAQRRQEIGIRAALGARRRAIVGMVMRDAGWLIAAGVAGGAVVSLLAGRSAATLLFGLTPHDPLTLVGASLLLAMVAATAGFVPASRASRLDALTAMRDE